MPALTRPNKAVTVSIIEIFPSHPASERTTVALHSQKDSNLRREMGARLMFCRNTIVRERDKLMQKGHP
jgi:hypothetical protein